MFVLAQRLLAGPGLLAVGGKGNWVCGAPPQFSEMESWRRAPTRMSGPGLVKALALAADLEGLRMQAADCSAMPGNLIAACSSAAVLNGPAEC